MSTGWTSKEWMNEWVDEWIAYQSCLQLWLSICVKLIFDLFSIALIQSQQTDSLNLWLVFIFCCWILEQMMLSYGLNSIFKQQRNLFQHSWIKHAKRGRDGANVPTNLCYDKCAWLRGSCSRGWEKEGCPRMTREWSHRVPVYTR